MLECMAEMMLLLSSADVLAGNEADSVTELSKQVGDYKEEVCTLGEGPVLVLLWGKGIASGGDLKIKAGFAAEVKEMEAKEM